MRLTVRCALWATVGVLSIAVVALGIIVGMKPPECSLATTFAFDLTSPTNGEILSGYDIFYQTAISSWWAIRESDATRRCGLTNALNFGEIAGINAYTATIFGTYYMAGIDMQRARDACNTPCPAFISGDGEGCTCMLTSLTVLQRLSTNPCCLACCYGTDRLNTIRRSEIMSS